MRERISPGECDLIMSFLMYNDITGMSVLHRQASSKMTRPAISIRQNRKLDLRFSFCSDDVSPQIRNPGCRTDSYE